MCEAAEQGFIGPTVTSILTAKQN